MSFVYDEDKIMEFLLQNKSEFEEYLLSAAVNVRDKIEEILLIGNVDLLNNAHKLVRYIVEQNETDLIAFAEQEGVTWATHSLTLSFKLEWIQALRRTLWTFLYKFEQEKKAFIEDSKVFFDLEKIVNEKVDEFLKSFFVSYSDYKDKLILAQQNLVENLSVPIIPITSTTCVLPLIGTIDYSRIQIIEEKVLMEIGKLRIQTLILDLSGIIEIEVEMITDLMKILDGTAMMGCKAVVTGLRPEVVTKMIRSGIQLDNKAETKGTLQQALKDYLVVT
ncbi:STAS domain-containing protein [Peribacillus frigoritolerans]|uniref:STAS domain-containing protein n=1 Tax=Peribacillus frigoritolerans TaxID=450367 RepID=UPI000A54D68B|nr:STAS domain-containing protein [Peribacillus frigoritolerans]MDP9739190.1 rsbT co-antagonist protein RsbR [Bacillus sp. B2I3]PEF40222.1 anti-anti-sigma factor [Bacillus sp. AFS094228]MCY8937094.1 STAS domain-containing protein [Peribacillus frigoritolerans]MCY9002628.1 STAS domain-containing protein [Peribacillus frigoritolerans]MDG4848964.1 STAS domain-containing protein [Peribacillus frigoritolerans]